MFVTDWAVVRDTDGAVVRIEINNCVEEGEKLSLSLVENQDSGVKSLLLEVESEHLKGVVAEEWLLPDVPDDVLHAIDSRGIVLKDLETSAEYYFQGIPAQRHDQLGGLHKQA